MLSRVVSSTKTAKIHIGSSRQKNAQPRITCFLLTGHGGQFKFGPRRQGAVLGDGKMGTGFHAGHDTPCARGWPRFLMVLLLLKVITTAKSKVPDVISDPHCSWCLK
jgi:hypothetical protein